MKLSETPKAKQIIKGESVDSPICIETKSDAHSLISNAFQLNLYISECGDNKVVYDAEWGVYRVPALKNQIDLYKAAKEIDMQRWGCEWPPFDNG